MRILRILAVVFSITLMGGYVSFRANDNRWPWQEKPQVEPAPVAKSDPATQPAPLVGTLMLGSKSAPIGSTSTPSNTDVKLWTAQPVSREVLMMGSKSGMVQVVPPGDPALQLYSTTQPIKREVLMMGSKSAKVSLTPPATQPVVPPTRP